MNAQAIRFIFLLAPFLFLTACDKDGQPKTTNKASITQSKLYKINSSAAFIKLNIDTSQKINCLLAKRAESRPIQNNDSKSGSSLKLMREEDENLCKFYTDILNVVNPVFESIEINGFIPKELFILTIIGYSYDNNESLKRTYEEDIVGLFKSLEDCESAKRYAQKINIPNKGCKKWDEKEF